jgi:hypothetical protein
MTAMRHWLSCATVLAMLAIGSAAGSIAAAQDQSTGGIETTRTARAQTEQTPGPDSSTDNPPADGEADNSSPASPNTADIDITGYEQTIAQGLAAFDGFSKGMWRITELKPLAADEAPSVTPQYYGFLYQMAGVTIVRNDVTKKRARLEPGEAYFFSAYDTYTRYREDTVSRAWLIEIVPTDAREADAAGTVIWNSGQIGGYPDDTRDLELIEANVMPDGTATVPQYEVDGLIMVTVGSLKITDAEGSTQMDAPAAVFLTSEAEIENLGSEPANYLIAKVGPKVADFVPPVNEDAATAEDTSSEEVDPMLDTDGDSLIDTDEAVYGTDPTIADSDYDGYSDGDEVIVYETDPLDPNSYP